VQQVEKDNHGELISQFDYSYDAAGNIVKEQTLPKPESVSVPPVTMTYSAANRLATYNGQAVQFDADGNMVSGPLAGEMANFRFDSRNRLVQAGDTSYRYDAENQRLGVNQTSYVINSQPALSQVLVKDENGVKTFYVYGLGLIGDEKEGEYRAYHFDFRGSTVALTDNAGKVVQRFQYGPYGELLKGDATVTPFLFNGKYGVMTEGNGLYYMRARFYSPVIKRFVNMDVWVGSVGEGQTLNRYAFVNGQPVNGVDPFGLYAIVVVDREGAGGRGHSAIVIQNRKTGQWESFSFGPKQPPPTDTLLDKLRLVLDTAYPGSVAHSSFPESDFGKLDGWIYDDFLVIKTTPEQEQGMIEFANNYRQKELYWRLYTNNCNDFVERVLDSQLPDDVRGDLIPNDLIEQLKNSYDDGWGWGGGVKSWREILENIKFDKVPETRPDMHGTPTTIR
jgi:RHS repeat-associated protein